jgi:hypothetical protein
MAEKNTVTEAGTSRTTWEALEPFVRAKIQELIQQLLEQEVTEYLGRQRYERLDETHAGYRNGYGKPRKLAMQGGTITVQRPRVRDLQEKFVSRVLPLFVRHTREVLPTSTKRRFLDGSPWRLSSRNWGARSHKREEAAG